MENKPVRHGYTWCKLEEAQLLRRFDSGCPLETMAKKHQRKENAILGRLVLLGRLMNESGRYYVMSRLPEIVKYFDMPEDKRLNKG